MDNTIVNLLEEYQTIPFPREGSAVYVIGIQYPARFVPVYVGESGRLSGRVGDYISAQFTASTDFKVGTAIRTFLAHGCDVVMKYQTFDGGKMARRAEEARLIKGFKAQGFELLNDLKDYDYRTADREVETKRINDFAAKILANIS